MKTAAQNKIDFEIRAMAAHHLDAILEIERESFATPWSKNGFMQEMGSPDRSCAIVAVRHETVIGYGVAWFIADETYIANIAVRSDHRREGVGTTLLLLLMEEGVSKGCQLATLEVRRSNRAAVELYEKFGFTAVALRKNYYRDTAEDAVVMVREMKEVERSKGRRVEEYTL